MLFTPVVSTPTTTQNSFMTLVASFRAMFADPHFRFRQFQLHSSFFLSSGWSLVQNSKSPYQQEVLPVTGPLGSAFWLNWTRINKHNFRVPIKFHQHKKCWLGCDPVHMYKWWSERSPHLRYAVFGQFGVWLCCKLQLQEGFCNHGSQCFQVWTQWKRVHQHETAPAAPFAKHPAASSWPWRTWPGTRGDALPSRDPIPSSLAPWSPRKRTAVLGSLRPYSRHEASPARAYASSTPGSSTYAMKDAHFMCWDPCWIMLFGCSSLHDCWLLKWIEYSESWWISLGIMSWVNFRFRNSKILKNALMLA